MAQIDSLVFVKSLISTLGKTESIRLLSDSNLTERESMLLELRLIKGKSLKEVADELMIEQDSVNKSQNRVCKKLHDWIRNKDNLDQVVALLNCTDYSQWQKVSEVC